MSANVIELNALDGANPLGFLAATGVLVELSQVDSRIKLRWRSGPRWYPVLERSKSFSEESLAHVLAKRLRGNPVDAVAERNREAAQRVFDNAKAAVKEGEKNLKARKLRGADRKAARVAEIEPLERARNDARKDSLAALKRAVPSAELAIGQRPDCTIREYREHAVFTRSTAQIYNRNSVDLLASFGAETDQAGDKRIEPTPFCFITGSGHQWFLDTARQLMAAVSEDKIREALFQPWAYRDEKLTMRWDPLDDRRYALMDRDPTASDNKSATIWMANLLAYRALALFPCVPGPYGLLAAGWSIHRGSESFSWPLWEHPSSLDTVRSLLQHRAFKEVDLSKYRNELWLRGAKAIFRARRIQVGNPPLHKINFTSAIGL